MVYLLPPTLPLLSPRETDVSLHLQATGAGSLTPTFLDMSWLNPEKHLTPM